MRNRQFIRKIVGLSMAVVMTIMSVETGGLQAYSDTTEILTEEQGLETQKIRPFSQGVVTLDRKDKSEKKTGYIDIGHEVKSVKNSGKPHLNMSVEIPESYSSVDKGYVTSIKNQRSWGTCWAFAACAAMESYALSHGLVESPEDVDFSEYALAYLTNSDDMYMDVTGDYTYTSNEYIGFDSGGNDEYAFKTLTKWAGIYNDDNQMYANSVSTGVVEEYIPDEDNIDFVLTGQYYINSTDREQVKAAIMENGAVTGSYYSYSYYSSNNDLYNYNYEFEGTNHAITVVGWDDNLDKNLFTMTDASGVTHTPENNGAWLIKNSWGTYTGNNGYCWISYEDYGFNSGNVTIYEISPKSYYDNIYQYDGATLFLASTWGRDFASIYEIDGATSQTLDAVSFATTSVNLGYTVKIYKNSDGNILDAGELLASKSGTVTYEGYYTVPMDETITLNPGESISVIISFDDYAYMVYEYDGFTIGMYDDTYVSCSSKEGRTYRRMYEGYEFLDYSSYGDLCIKAFTSNVGEEIEVPRITEIDDSDITQLVIKWKEIEGAESYTLCKSTSSTGEDAEYITNITENFYTDTDVVVGNTYYYKVCAYVSGNPTSYSVVKSAKVELGLTMLKGVNNGDYVTLSWEEISSVDGYKLYKSKDGAGYELLKTFDNTVTSFNDYDFEYGITYSYVICTYKTINNQYYESAKGSAFTTTRQVPMAEDISVDGIFYNKMLVTWTKIDNVDGYNIYVCIGDEDYYTLVADLDADVTEYWYDVTGVEAGTYCYFAVEPYIMIDGEQYVNDRFAYYYETMREAPLEVEDIRWYIEDGLVCVKFKAEESEYGYTIWYSDDNNFGSYVDVETDADEDGFITAYMYFDSYEQMEVYITDYYVDKMFQEKPFKIMGEYKEPVLNYINDILLTEGVTTTTLTATITNPMENFEYLYQWYVSDTATGEATAIEGATSNVYTATVAADEEKYYYCSVICRHEEETTTNTTNSNGNRTKVAGNKSQTITVSDVADQTYTGSAITPNVTVTKGTKTLTKGTDYTLSYTNNVNAGTATITVTFKGDHADIAPVTKTFIINPRGISDVNYTYTKEYNYTGTAIKPVPTITNGIGTLVNGTDYTLSYANNTNIGTATITVTFKGNYTGTKTLNFTIKDAVPTSITSTVYSINQSGKIISKITVGTTVSTFLNGLKEKEYIVIKKGNTVVDSSSALGTGMKAYIMNGNAVVNSYDIIVTGDTNGDGKINITDMIAVKAHILKKSTLSGIYSKAGDVNGDGKINITDFIKIKATLLKKDSITGVEAK